MFEVDRLSNQVYTDELGILRFFMICGEALLVKNLNKLLAVIDPLKHLVILDRSITVGPRCIDPVKICTGVIFERKHL